MNILRHLSLALFHHLPSSRKFHSKIYLFLVGTFLWTAVAIPGFSADTVQVMFDEANQKLQEGYYEEALQTYKTIEQNKKVSGPLFLNMGIAYTRLDSLGNAKYYFLKAQTFPSTRDQAKQALNYVNEQFSNQSAILPKLPWDRAIDWLSNRWGAVGTFTIGFLLVLLAVSTLIYSWFFRRFSQPAHWSSRILFAVGILIILLSLYMNYVDYRYDRAVMTTEETVVKQQPDLDGTTISKAYEGYTFTVDHHKSDTAKQWYYVRLPNGMHGWIQKGNIKIL